MRTGFRSFGPTCLILALGTVAAQARIVRVTIMPTAPETSRHVPASFDVLQGVAFGELDPRDPHNRIIQDIGMAEKNARGLVEYSTSFTLYVPKHPASNAVLLYDVVNRGGEVMPREYVNGDFFLVSGWQGDIPFGGRANNGTRAETIRVPVAHQADGKPLTGPVFARFIDQTAGQQTMPLARSITYGANDLPPIPLDMETRHAELLTKRYEDVDGATGGIDRIAPEDWSWGDCGKRPFPGVPDATKICLKNGANPDLLYELHYTAKDPLVLGVGLAAMRDINLFFRNALDDEYGFKNPVAGKVRAVIATGVSQSGNTLRDFINLGFNQGDSGDRVFDGVMPIVSVRQTPLNVRFGVPGGTSMLYELGTDGVSWWGHVPDPVRHNPDGGEMDRCTATGTCPKIMELLGSTEFYSLRASLAFVGTTANADLPLPPNVRRYYVASTTHGGGSGGFQRESKPMPNCVLAPNPNPENPTRRALLLALKYWVIDGTAPPESVYPTLRAGTLADAATVLGSFPRIPGEPLPHDVLNPNLIYDLGPDFHANDLSGVPLQEPPRVIGAARTMLPTLDTDGNEEGGIHSVLQQAPLGTYIGWNPVNSGFRKGQFCPLTGAYIPFANTASERAASHDPRPSIEERYSNHQEYVDRVRDAAARLVKQRLLLEDDAAKAVADAQASDVRR